MAPCAKSRKTRKTRKVDKSKRIVFQLFYFLYFLHFSCFSTFLFFYFSHVSYFSIFLAKNEGQKTWRLQKPLFFYFLTFWLFSFFSFFFFLTFLNQKRARTRRYQTSRLTDLDHWGDPDLVLHQFVDPKSEQLGEYEHHGQTVSTVPIIHCIMHYYIMGMKDGISL